MANSIIWKSSDTDKPLEVAMHVGDTVRVHYRLIEKEKIAGKTKREVKVETRERIQVFEGIILAIKGHAENAMFTVRKIGADTVGIERVFPVMTPWIRKIEIKKYGEVRRAKLYYLRGRIGKAASRVDEAVQKSVVPAKAG